MGARRSLENKIPREPEMIARHNCDGFQSPVAGADEVIE
jgi:hypothetical protein